MFTFFWGVALIEKKFGKNVFAHISDKNKPLFIFLFFFDFFVIPAKKRFCSFQTKTNQKHNRTFDPFLYIGVFYKILNFQIMT